MRRFASLAVIPSAVPNSQQNSAPPALVLKILAKVSKGLTAGDLRRKLVNSKAGEEILAKLSNNGKPASAQQVQDAAYQWWRNQQIVVEPPPPGKHVFRLWHPHHVPESWQSPELNRADSVEKPASPRDQQLMIQICGQLVSTWKRTPNENTKRTLQSILNNLGLDREGEVGQQLPFKGRNHECATQTVNPGDLVEIREPGWLLKDCPGDYLLLKAQVVKL